ncbi:MAG: hypothetical protein JW827_12765 [Spirochaetes bacterium]|nr:hypothetical protein [Spirochaetota bacterium]
MVKKSTTSEKKNILNKIKQFSFLDLLQSIQNKIKELGRFLINVFKHKEKRKIAFYILGGVLFLFLVIGVYNYIYYLNLNIKYAFNCVPDDYSYFVYIKDFSGTKEKLDSSPLKKVFDNNLFKDLGNKFKANINLFFFHMEFNLDYLITLIRKDFLVAKVKDHYFLASSISLKARIIEMLFNLLPDEGSKEIKFKSQSYHHLLKNNRSFYYAILERYLVVTDNEELMKEIILSAFRQKDTVETDTVKQLKKDDILLKVRVNPSGRALNLLPDLSTFSFIFNVGDSMITLWGAPGRIPEKQSVEKVLAFSKFYKMDLAFCYYNPAFTIKDIVSLSGSSSRDEFDRLNKAKRVSIDKIADNFEPGLFMAFDGFNISGKTKDNTQIFPRVSFALKVKGDQKPEIKILLEKCKDLISYFTGAKGWKKADNQSKDYSLFYDPVKEISLIRQADYMIITLSQDFHQDLVSGLDKIKPTLYDKFHDHFKEGDHVLYYGLVNPDDLSVRIKDLMEQYILNYLKVDTKEYQESFEILFQDMKKIKPFSIILSYDEKKGKYFGQIQFVP